jgi:hypothetical protein
MEGVQYIINEKGQKKAVIIDLETFPDLWEDIHDLLVLESRKNEPRSNWKDIKKRKLKMYSIWKMETI